MIYFISDLHLGHDNVIKFNNRPFGSVDEMDEALIEKWNARVKGDDTVYILGDLLWETADPEKYLPRLYGRKILITGNHDGKWLSRGEYSGYFENITPYLETVIDGKTVTLCHYPMFEWKYSRKMGSRKLGIHIYGHIHNSARVRYRPLWLLPHSYNAGADINDYAPVTMEELERNNERYKLSVLSSPEDKALFLASKYHLYQADKSGRPYIEHPTAVAAQLNCETDRVVGYLHDIVEDTDIDITLLEREFSHEIVEAVLAMTHREGEDYFDYIERVKQNETARRVKLADLTHNMDMSRFKVVTEFDLVRLEKYKKAKSILMRN